MQVDGAMLEDHANALRLRAGVVGVAAVGSFARGAARPGSDLDIVVLTDSDGPPSVAAFAYADRPTEALFMPERALRAALDDPRRGAQTIATWAGARILHDRDGRLAALLAEVEAVQRRGAAPMTDEEREYARFELTHARGLIEEAAASLSPTDRATCRLLIASTVRGATGTLLRHARRWPVGWRATLPALRALDPEAADRAVCALTAPEADAANAAMTFIDHALRALGGPLRPGP